MRMSTTHATLDALATQLRTDLATREFILLYAYNGTGKTRLSTAFKEIGKHNEGEDPTRDTLYFNAFTEDLFTWDNDLEGDSTRVLRMNIASRFFDGLEEMEMENRIGKLLSRYADFDFRIDYETSTINFSRQVHMEGEEPAIIDNIKVSRGEQNIFLWCFFLAIVQIRLDDTDDTGPYSWVKLIYIDDPVSSLDEHNAIVVANHLVQVFRESSKTLPTVISTHHHLFFNVLHYEFRNHFQGNCKQLLLTSNRVDGTYVTQPLKGDTPSFHHVSALTELHRISESDTIHTYHFNMLRVILEKTALFHGYPHFSACIKRDGNDADGILHQRFVDLLSHGKYSLFEPSEMGEETKAYFRTILRGFLERYQFNPALFSNNPEETPIP
ncbi:AAA family ATPase [bacterium]|nr:AAA family ATPase [bacterium]